MKSARSAIMVHLRPSSLQPSWPEYRRGRATEQAMRTILDEIVESKAAELDARRAVFPPAEVHSAAKDAPPARDFFAALSASPRGPLHLIAEIKRKSPSAGLIRPDFDPATIARLYYQAGASALSVLTDEPYFDGRLEYIDAAKAAVPLPVLRKDFLIDPYQVYEARAAGADAILLIGEILEPSLLAEMLAISYELGMSTLIEVHSAETLDAVQAKVHFPNNQRCLLGINNRDLSIQQTDLANTARLAGRVPAGTLIVAESGIKTAADVQAMVIAGAKAILVGETLMKAVDIPQAVRELLGKPDAPSSRPPQ